MLSSVTVKVGDAVSFGRKRGATAYGTVERVSNKTATVRLTKQYNSNPPGALFRVPFSLLSPADVEAVKPTPATAAEALKLIRGIDWPLLRKEKNYLLYRNPRETVEVEGILSLIDALQDFATDILGVTESEVFAFEEATDV
jgi:hypothetical protein